MNIVRPVDTSLTPEQARARQTALASQLQPEPIPNPLRIIAATDVAYDKETDEAYASIVLLSYPDLEVIERKGWIGEPGYPYVPGLFSLREATCLLQAFEFVENRPDVILVDGHGMAHPRRFGLACLLGWSLDVPSIGCAKKRLTGAFDPVAEEAGSLSYLRDEEEVIGAVLRTQNGINPVYVSAGYRCELSWATDLIMTCAGEYRIPTPLREAHMYSVELRSEGLAEE